MVYIVYICTKMLLHDSSISSKNAKPKSQLNTTNIYLLTSAKTRMHKEILNKFSNIRSEVIAPNYHLRSDRTVTSVQELHINFNSYENHPSLKYFIKAWKYVVAKD